MLRNISLVLSALVFVGCSTTSENLQKKELKDKKQDIVQKKVIENEEVDTAKAKKIIKEVINDINSVPMTRIDLNVNSIEKIKDTKEKITKFSFSGKWIGTRTSKFLQRRIELNQVNESYARGHLEMSFLNTTGEETIANKFNMEVFLKDYIIEGFIKDVKTSKIEKVKIFRDSENEFRVIPSENSIFFENESMMFTKAEIIKQKVEDKQIEIIKNYFKKVQENVIDSKNNLIWQDGSASKFLKANYENANFYCENLGDFWRLPSRNEIKDTYSIVNDSINSEFKNFNEVPYWTNEESIDDVLKAWSFNYKSGKEIILDKDEKLNIRCVKENKDIK